MKTAAINALKKKLAASQPTYGIWISLESATVSEMAVALGLDWIVIDAEHGHLDWKEILEHIRATVRSDTVALVRIAELNSGLIKRALDIGADGIVVPWIETPAQLKQAVAFANYPPEGVRGIGAERATAWGECFSQHTREANEHVLVVPIIESVAAGRNIQQLCAVPGVDVLFLGPADYSSSAGYKGQWEGPGVAAELLAIKDTICASGKCCGIVTSSVENLVERRDQGFRMLGIGFDTGLLLRSLHSALRKVGRDRSMQPSFAVEPVQEGITPLPREPAAKFDGKNKFLVKFTADFNDSAGAPKYSDIGLSTFADEPQIEHGVFKEHRQEIGADQIEDAQGVIVLTPTVKPASVRGAPNLLAVARFGVGYEAVDVKACTEADVLVTITRGAVDRSVAEATVGWMIALSHSARIKDSLVRAGQWDRRSGYMGCELRDRTLGVIGLGGIGRKTIELLRDFGMNQPLALDPLLTEETALKYGARLVSLQTLLQQSDFVSIHCPLNEQTRGLIGATELALMKPGAYLLNTARGGIVREDALYDALKGRRIAGAALDCFEQEPVTSAPRLAEFDNVLLAPHCIAWTDELFRDIGRAACQVMVDLSLGKRPEGVINPEVFDQPGFKAKWERCLQTPSQ